jgi:choline-sulfatase
MSFMTGRFVHQIGSWDNGTPLGSDVPTWAHLVRAAGYDAVLAGKQHFVGLDQLHGFRAQLARDLHAEMHHPIYDWGEGTPAATMPWPALAQAGPGSTMEIEVDDAVEAAALGYLKQAAGSDTPWVLNVSFIAPHFPFIVPQPYWDMYPPEKVDLPVIPPGHLERQHPVYKRIRSNFGLPEFPEILVRRARAGYYGLISYLDDKIGRILQELERTGQRENTVVIYCADHGEMAGEHGMWRKSNFYEHASRIPLIISWPGVLNRGVRVQQTVSLVDLVATLMDMTGAEPVDVLDGDSLLPLARGATESWKDEAFSELHANGISRPMAMLRRGRYKFNYSLDDPPELYDLVDDPAELYDLAGDPARRALVDDFRTRLFSRWDPIELERRVRQSQKARRIIRSVETGASPESDMWTSKAASPAGATN